MRRFKRGFTLIELLVVIAIIGLLISILIPSLSRARDMARSAMCKSNMRQVSHGWHLYADDHKDISVPGRFGSYPGGKENPANWYNVGNGLKVRPRWIAVMGKYVGVFAFREPVLADERQDYDAEVYQCPAAPDRVDERNHALGYNHHFLGNARLKNGRFVNFPVNRTRIKSFGGTVLAADSMGTAAGVARSNRGQYSNNGTTTSDDGNHAWSLDPPRLTDRSDRGTGDAGSPRTAVAPRHLSKSNAVYCDGHAETLPIQELGYRTLPDGKFVDLESMDDSPDNKLFSGTGRDDDPPAIP